MLEDIWSEVVSHPESFILADPHNYSDYFPLAPIEENDYEIEADNPFSTETWILSSHSLTDSDIHSVIQTFQSDSSLNVDFENPSSLPESPASSPLLDMDTPLNLPLDIALALQMEPHFQEVMCPPSIAFIDCTGDDDDEVIELETGNMFESRSLASDSSPLATPVSSPNKDITTAPQPLPFKIIFTPEKPKRSSTKKRTQTLKNVKNTKTTTGAAKKKKPQKAFYESEESDSDIEAELFEDEEVSKKTKTKKRKTKKSKDPGPNRLKVKINQPELLALYSKPVTSIGSTLSPAAAALALAAQEKKTFAPEFLAKTFSSEQILKMRSKDERDEEGDVDIL